MHPKGTNSMALSRLGHEMSLVGARYTVSLV